MNKESLGLYKKVRRNHPQRRFRIALGYYGNKRGLLQQMSDWEAAQYVAKKFGYTAQQIWRAFWRNMDLFPLPAVAA